MATAAAAAGGLLAVTRKSIDSLLGDVGGLLADLTSQEQQTGATNDEENEQARRVIDVELQRFWQGYYDLKRRHDENSLSVAVLALTKSGKSTFLNALMGMEVLPMNNVPETARICRIVHDATAREPLLRDASGRIAVRGDAAVRARLQQLNSAARNYSSSGGGSGFMSPQSSGALAGGSDDAGGTDTSSNADFGSAAGGSGGYGGSPLLHISAPLVALEGFGAEFGRVTLLDTPGPNEAGEEQLKYQVERLLEGVDCVLYLLDYTKLKTAEEEGLFRRLRTINPQLVARLSSRLFFVINKVDASETSEGLDPEEVRAYVADLVTRQLGGVTAGGAGTSLPSRSSSGVDPPASPASPARSDSTDSVPAPAAPFQLRPDQVLLLSARNALLARLVLAGRAGPDAMKRFQRLAFGAFGGMGMGRSSAAPSNEQLRVAAGCLLENSGILELEGRVLAFLAAHAGSVKLLATADDTSRLLAQIRNVALACRSCLHRNVTVLQEQAGELRNELAEATGAFEDVRARTDAVQAEVVTEIKSHLNTLRRRLFTQIIQTLDTDARAPAPSAMGNAGTGSSPFSRWARVREKFLSMFTATTSTLPPQSRPGAGPSLVPAARSSSREELQTLLLDLHDDLMSQIHSEVYDFWGVLEACAASRHTELLSALNTHLTALSRRVEGAVSEALGVELAPADIRLRPPSAEQLHSDVQGLITKGIREGTEKHLRVATRTTMERVPKGHPSLCRWGGYWTEVPRTRTVVETYNATVYTLQPDEIVNHFIGLVDGAVSASEQALASYVAAMVERQLEAARSRIKEYSDRYLSAMNAALDASSRGTECRNSALAAVENYLGRLDKLQARAQALQQEAEAAVPGGAAGLMDEVEVYDDEDEYEQEYSESVPAQERSVEEYKEDSEEGEEVSFADGQPEAQGDGQGEQAGGTEQHEPGACEATISAEAVAVVTEGDAVDVDSSDTAAEGSDGESSAAVASLAPVPSRCSIPDIDEIELLEDLQDSQSATALEDTAAAATASDEEPPVDDTEESADVASDSSDIQDPANLQQAADASSQSSVQVQEQPAAAVSAVPAPASNSVGNSPYPGAPFDYSRAFLEAMSTSEMTSGVVARDEPLTMIPLKTGCGADGRCSRAGDNAPSSPARGTDTPLSGVSDEWQLVGEEALEVLATRLGSGTDAGEDK